MIRLSPLCSTHPIGENSSTVLLIIVYRNGSRWILDRDSMVLGFVKGVDP